ncbi:hypothetical protein [Clostridium sp.]|uniref:hypothetical protein n=1 Tax=Clostridium sp. TaxID=1506 RepID=UPI0034642C43
MKRKFGVLVILSAVVSIAFAVSMRLFNSIYIQSIINYWIIKLLRYIKKYIC